MNQRKKTMFLATTLILGMSGAALAQQGDTGSAGSGAMSGSMSSGTSSGTPSYDYRLLTNPHYDYIDLMKA
ncbi:MAG: hypothetical protein JO250_23055, partial [Armatimonadetes bacterium]|nr:hypothetical protein [Armatimonadota bacterium]